MAGTVLDPRVIWLPLDIQPAVRSWLDFDPALWSASRYSLCGEMLKDLPNGSTRGLLRVELPVRPDHAAKLIGRAWCCRIEARQGARYNVRIHATLPLGGNPTLRTTSTFGCKLPLENGSRRVHTIGVVGGRPAKINPPPMVGLQVPQGVQDGSNRLN